MSFDGLRMVRVCLVFILFLSALASSARAVERIDLVSRALPGLVSDTGGSQSSFPLSPSGVVRQTVSADGRYVVFASSAPNLTAGLVKNNTGADIFLYDRVAGTLRLVSHTPVGPNVTGNNSSSNPSISADGRYVAFTSTASTLAAAADFNTVEDVFLFDRETGVVTLVSHGAGTNDSASNNASFNPMISTDGNWVVFVSRAGNLVPGQVELSSFDDVFLWERATNTNTLVSHIAGSPASDADSGSAIPAVSADGSWVAYTSFATNLAADVTDFNGMSDIYLWERATDTNRLVSRTSASATTPGNGSSQHVRMSADGAWILFFSLGTDFVTGQTDANGAFDAFLYSRDTGEMMLVSHAVGAPATTGSGGVQEPPTLSADGNWVAFASAGTNHVAGQIDTNGTGDAFLWSRASQAIELVSRQAGTTATAAASTTNFSYNAEVSADGGRVAYVSRATNLVAGQSDANVQADLFLFDRAAGTNALLSGANGSATAVSDNASKTPVFSADGQWIAFVSTSSDLLSSVVDTNTSDDVFLYDRSGGTTTLVSRRDAASPSDTAGGISIVPFTTITVFVPSATLSANGRYVAFQSTADRMVPGQVKRNSTGYDVFFYDRQTGGIALVSRAAGTTADTGNAVSQAPVLSADGRYVAFVSRATNLVAGQIDAAATDDVFLWDSQTGTLTLVSRTAASPVTAAGGSAPALAADGSAVAFLSSGTSLVAGQTDSSNTPDVFLFDRISGANTLVSHRSTGPAVAGGGSSEPWISADGQAVAFLSNSSILVDGQTDANGGPDLFQWNRTTGAVTLVSSGSASATTAIGASAPAQSADGNWLAFSSPSNAVIPGLTDTNSLSDIFLWERATGTKRLVSRTVTSATTAGNFASLGVMLNADGSRAVFLSRSTNLVTGTDTNNAIDAYVFDRATGLVALASHTPAGAGASGNAAVTRVGISADGSRVSFLSTATNLVSGQTDASNTTDLFRYDPATGAVGLLSRRQTSATAAGTGSEAGALSANGSVVVFTSPDGAIVPNDHNARHDVFLWSDETLADLSITKTDGVTSAVPGQTVTYTIVATNAGPTAVTGALVTDSFPAALQGVSWACAAAGGASCAGSGSGSLSQLVDLPVGGIVTFTVTGTVAADATGTLANTASIAAPAGVADPDGTDNSATDTDSLAPQADLSISMTDSPDPVERGATLTYLISVTNAGPSAAASVSVVDTLPAGVTFVSAADGGWTCGETGGVVTCTRPSLAPGSAPDLTVQVTAPVARGFATLTNTVAVTAATADPVANNGASTETSVPQPGVTVTPVSGLTTTEAGGEATFTVVLDNPPLADVTIALTSGDTDEGTVSPASVTFTTGTWSTPQTVTVTGVDDDYDDGDIAFTITTGAASSTDVGYDGLDPADVSVTNQDDDTAGVEVSPTSGLVTTEAGGTATFTVVLTAQPSADVTIAVESSDPGEGEPSPASLTFTTGTWDTPQTVTVTGVDDDLADGNVAYTLLLQPAESGDPAFDGLDPEDVSATNQDDGFEGVFYTVAPCRALDTRQPGQGPALASGQVTLLQMRGVCGIPATARAVAVNLTYTAATRSGDLVVYPGDLAQVPLPGFVPVTQSITRATALVMPLGADGTLAFLPVLQAADPTPTVHIIVDVTGYFE